MDLEKEFMKGSKKKSKIFRKKINKLGTQEYNLGRKQFRED